MIDVDGSALVTAMLLFCGHPSNATAFVVALVLEAASLYGVPASGYHAPSDAIGMRRPRHWRS
jgi:hypothetical protein